MSSCELPFWTVYIQRQLQVQSVTGASGYRATLLTGDFQLNASVVVVVTTDIKNRKRIRGCPHECLFV